MFALLTRPFVGVDGGIETAAKLGSRVLTQRRERIGFFQQAPALADVGECGSLAASAELDQSLDNTKYRETLGNQGRGTFPFGKNVLQLFRPAGGLDEPLVA